MEFFMNDSSFLHISSWAEFSELLPVVAPYVETVVETAGSVPMPQRP